MKRHALLLVLALVILCVVAYRLDTQNSFHAGVSHLIQMLTRDHLTLPYHAPPAADQWQFMNASDRLADVSPRLLPKLHDELATKKLHLGQPAFIRIFKESRELELWLESGDKQWQLFRNYPIACFSGTLGPKTREGDMQAPEGFYTITQKQLNPMSRYHLSFNVGYPNAYDLAHQRTGSLIMVHGDTCSIGCFAMTDPLIEEIYLVVEAALETNTTVPIHIFPFRMNGERMQKALDSPHLEFWQNLRPAFDLFEKDHRVPQITVENSIYRIH